MTYTYVIAQYSTTVIIDLDCWLVGWLMISNSKIRWSRCRAILLVIHIAVVGQVECLWLVALKC